MANNLLCTYCGRNEYVKDVCPAKIISAKRLDEYPKVVSHNRVPGPKFKKVSLPVWLRKNLILALSFYWKLKLKYVSKANK